MIDVANKLDEIEGRIMSGLKDFQQATVNRIDELYRSGQMRVLVSDEVGLGKTLIAKGTIAKLAKMQKASGDKLVKVVYICSNSAIAGQNLDKLRISNEVRTEATSSSRLSMQHLNIFMQESDEQFLKQYVQLIPLTPDTSFRMTGGAGTVDERALMFALLRRIPELESYLPQLDVAMRDWAYKAWNWYRNDYEEKVVKCDDQSGGKYIQYMTQRIMQELNIKRKNGTTYLEELITLCQRIKHSGNRRVNDNSIIGKLRVMFAQISLDKLEPDLVIMDEFQRFKYLIHSDPDTETGMLAAKFFNAESVRMLLLSATPYKMYSTLEEIDENDGSEEHYKEFMDVMAFLNVTEQENEHFHTVWSNYSVNLKELASGETTILAAKQAAEDALYSHICRTERISATESADIIDAHEVKEPLEVTASDIKSYLQAQKLLEDIHLPYNVPIDYIKSCPYLLSFMNDYKVKRDIERYFAAHPDDMSVLNRDCLWLKRSSFDKFDAIDPGNARLERVLHHAFKHNAENLLWVPPSKPYYPLSGAFAGSEHFSKTLIFSSWEMVPRMLAGLLSYEAERRTIGLLAKQRTDRDVRYFHDDKKRFPAAKLNFSVKDNSPNAMTLFCLMYPSRFLADCYDPIECMNKGMSLSQIEAAIKERISGKLQKFSAPQTGVEDKKWYYLFPLVLDGPGYVQTWLGSDDTLSAYGEEDEKAKKQKGFQRHLQELRELYQQTSYGRTLSLGKMPPDLLEVLATMAIASPAICAYRLYRQYAGNGSIPSYMPSQIAKVFINRMNTPESTAVIDLCYGEADDAHWQNVLNYCKDGNLQAMFDEYGHLLTNGLDRDEKLLPRLHRSMIESMQVRTTAYKVDTLNDFRSRMTGKKEKAVNIRTHFAVSFTKGIGEKDADRKKSVRNSFNSPFRPFVLASTSIGQEGLDFHNYCRRIVHWNLPTNPIDLEQREGRINRFECLAIRQNVAQRYGVTTFQKDIWAEMFQAARKAEKTSGCSDLIPFWGLTESEDMVRIERIVPMYPFSRDEISYERLIKILSLYRLTLGQARQEELLEYIFQNFDDTAQAKDLFINLSPFYKHSPT